MAEILLIAGIIFLFSIVQSIFGMGILVFGTPTFLLLGYDFTETLAYLLPSSFMISVLQVFKYDGAPVKISNNLYTISLPAIIAGLILVQYSYFTEHLRFLVGIVLIFSALIREIPNLLSFFKKIVIEKITAYHLAMGLIHGLTNLGGALLAVLASTSENEKLKIRYTIAHYYLLFSAIQILTLGIILGHYKLLVSNLALCLVAVPTYLLLGNRIFIRAKEDHYRSAMSTFMLAYGLAIIGSLALL